MIRSGITRSRGTGRAWVVLATVLLAASCLDDSITGSRPLAISLDADPTTVAVSEPVTLSFLATGSDIVAVVLDFGDGAADTLTYAQPPVEVEDQRVHGYDAPGSYTAEGTVIAAQGRTTDEVVITVNAPGEHR